MLNIFKNIITTLILLNSIVVNAEGLNFINKNSSSNYPLSPQEAFNPKLNLEKEKITIELNIKPNHYIYKDKLHLTINNKNYNLEKPNGIFKNDAIYGNVEIYEDYIKINSEKINENKKELKIDFTYQGCSEEFNICYPVEKISITENNIYKNNFKEKTINNSENINIFNSSTDANFISKFINDKNIFITILMFSLIGILMAFTPCVFPMVPIISSIIVKHDKKHPVLVSSLYVLGIGLCYSTIGIILSLFNFNIQVALQNIYFLILTSIFIFILALTMFGFINIRMPNFIQSKLHEKTEELDKKNNYHSLILSGFISALMLSPCAVAPLAGALLFASKYENYLYSTFLLFVLGFSSGLPLIIFASSLKKILPKAGKWMYEIKYLIGILMVFVSYSLLDKVISHNSYDLIRIIFNTVVVSTLIFYFLKFSNFDIKNKISLGFIFLTIIFTIFFSNKGIEENDKNIKEEFLKLNKIEDLKIDSKTLIYVGADWCVSCRQMESSTFRDKEVIEELKKFKVYYLDITDVTPEEKEILSKYNLQIAPFYVLYDSNEKQFEEINIGYLDKIKFLEMLKKIN